MDVADDIAYSTSDMEDAFTSDQLDAGDFLYPKKQVVAQMKKNILAKAKTDPRQEEWAKNLDNAIIETYLREFAVAICKFVYEEPFDRVNDIANVTPEQEKQIYKASERIRTDVCLRRQFGLFGFRNDMSKSNRRMRTRIAFNPPPLGKDKGPHCLFASQCYHFIGLLYSM